MIIYSNYFDYVFSIILCDRNPRALQDRYCIDCLQCYMATRFGNKFSVSKTGKHVRVL
jgi:hypothetical protein